MTTNDNPTSEAAVERHDWGRVTVSLAEELARQDFPRGDLAALRRMSPATAVSPPFWRLAARHDLLRGRIVERKWALVIHGMALMTPTSGGGSAHNPTRSVGAALYLGNDSHRTSALYSEARLSRLLNARETMLHTLLTRMFRMLASAGVSFDWREMARFIMYDGFNAARAEEARRSIARSYYREEYRQVNRP